MAKIPAAFALALVLTLTPAFAADPGTGCRTEIRTPSLVVLETAAPDAPLALRTAGEASHPIVLEASPSHLVLAVAEPSVVDVDGPAACELMATVNRAEIRRREVLSDDGATRALAISFYAAGIHTKEEDHEIDPDPKSIGRFDTKEEDHEIDPDPKDDTAARPLVTLIAVAENLVLKEEDHEIDPDPKRADAVWASDWALTATAVRTLGPGWYFVVRGGEVSYEILIEPRD